MKANDPDFRNKHKSNKDSNTEHERFQALVLDCDGVMVDSEPLSCGAWNVVFYKEFKIDIGTDYSGILGKNSADAAIYYLEKHGIPITEDLVETLIRLKEKTYFELARGKLRPINGIKQLISQAREKKWPVGVASSGTIKKITFNLKEAGLYDLVDVIVGAEGENRGKPFPDVFLEVAKKMQVKPSRCIAIEDTPAGIKSAKKAGMFVIALAKTFPPGKLLSADKIVKDLMEIDLGNVWSSR